MKKLTADLKRMLAGLACQDAGDYLSLDEKLRQIGQPEQGDTPRSANADVSHAPATPRLVAVVTTKLRRRRFSSTHCRPANVLAHIWTCC